MDRRSLVLFAALLAGCGARVEPSDALPSSPATVAEDHASANPANDDAAHVCRDRVARALAEPGLSGAPKFEAARIAILGRARGAPMFFVRAPEEMPDEALSPIARAWRATFARGTPGTRVRQLVAQNRHDQATLRALVLREGYLFTDDPLDAFALVSDLKIAYLFTDEEVWLERGAEVSRLERDARHRDVVYRYAEGPSEGRAADVLFGDRLALRREDLATPLHRDIEGLMDDFGFDRASVAHRTKDALVADLVFGDLSVRALIEADGAALRFGCFAEDRATRDAVDRARSETLLARRALARIRTAVTEAVDESLHFDRPEGETGPDRDGELRPSWATAYLQGRASFEVDDTTYSVFDASGRPTPPEVCVDFVIDSYERAAGTWFRPRGGSPGRVKGAVDFDATPGRPRGVIAFGTFADAHSERFSMRRFQGAERIQFADRDGFFGFLAEHTDAFHAGDVVAIQGVKRDKRVHQHAILIERTDPLTGFPYGLADQMRRPRRRTWEGIMAEAPARSLLYRARPTAELLGEIASAE